MALASSGADARIRVKHVLWAKCFTVVVHTALCIVGRSGPKRKNLRVRNPEKYQWKPAELLKQLARVYLNLSRADRAGDFVAAIAADQRSYHEGIFVEAAEVRASNVGGAKGPAAAAYAARWTRRACGRAHRYTRKQPCMLSVVCMSSQDLALHAHS